MPDEINQRILERELALRLEVIHGYASPSNVTIAAIQANELLEELRVLAGTKPAYYEQQKGSLVQLCRLIGLSPERTKALITAYALPR